VNIFPYNLMVFAFLREVPLLRTWALGQIKLQVAFVPPGMLFLARRM